jgi:glycosyltransferase involved in cell wall biosynthesis
MLTAIILTYNEKIHIKRCLQSAQSVADQVIVIDSFSQDDTCAIAQSMGAELYQNKFVHQAQQFQWALDNANIKNEWVIRLDADEYLEQELVQNIKAINFTNVDSSIAGYDTNRKVIFLGKWIKRGMYPDVQYRIFRKSAAYMEQKWMDEHIQLKTGQWNHLPGDMVDHNLNTITWWTNKHNQYATREAIVRLHAEQPFLDSNTANVKSNKGFYLKLPLFYRVFFYFGYRYFIKLGFLDGHKGLIWHLLQGLWYQLLVDVKMYQIKSIANTEQKSIREVLAQHFGVEV